MTSIINRFAVTDTTLPLADVNKDCLKIKDNEPISQLLLAVNLCTVQLRDLRQDLLLHREIYFNAEQKFYHSLDPEPTQKRRRSSIVLKTFDESVIIRLRELIQLNIVDPRESTSSVITMVKKLRRFLLPRFKSSEIACVDDLARLCLTDEHCPEYSLEEFGISLSLDLAVVLDQSTFIKINLILARNNDEADLMHNKIILGYQQYKRLPSDHFYTVYGTVKSDITCRSGAVFIDC